jgi:hypothetical protein
VLVVGIIKVSGHSASFAHDIKVEDLELNKGSKMFAATLCVIWRVVKKKLESNIAVFEQFRFLGKTKSKLYGLGLTVHVVFGGKIEA